jgi:hypothetical protein
MICSNCNSKHGCSCKARKASDGASVCTNCLVSYEAKLNSKGTPIQPIKSSPQNLAPQNVTLLYKQGK